MIRKLTAVMVFWLAACCLAMVPSGPALAETPRGMESGQPAARVLQPAIAIQKAQMTPAATGTFDRLWLWVMERQRELTTAMTGAVRRLQGANFWSAAAQLGIISFLYGVFHAAGPGHGKFIISSYALANARTLRRGVAVSFMAAFLQAVSAIAIVGVLVVVVKATSLEIRRAEAWLETASWGLIAVLGAWLLWSRLGAVFGRAAAAPVGAVHAGHETSHHVRSHDHGRQHRGDHHHDHHHHAPGESCSHCAHDHDHSHSHSHSHSHHTHPHQPAAVSHTPAHHHAASQTPPTHAHHTHGPGEHCDACGHVHAPSPADLQGAWSWRQAWSIAFAVGIRPCTGAIAVLLFSLGTGLIAAGIFATFAMAIGTALTVSALATLAVTSRDLAARMAGSESRWAGRIQEAAGIVGSLLVFLLGASFFVASLSSSGPL